jgi:hypothetical protein
MIRPFELRDLPLLNRYRQRGLFLDSIPTLTWGRGLVPAGAIFSPFSSALGVFTSFCQNEDESHEPLIGQITHSITAPFAHFTYLAPDTAIDSPNLNPLLESLIKRVGERGAQSLIAEVDEDSHTFEALRKANFSIYSRQTLWRIDHKPLNANNTFEWIRCMPEDEINIWRLYSELVPTLVQQVESSPTGHLNGWVLYKDGEILGFVAMVMGPRGIYLQPFIHPDMEDVDSKLAQLISRLAPKKKRPVYICLRSYHSWLSTALEDMGAQPGPNQAVMVRRLALPIKKPVLSSLPQIKNGTEATTTYYETPKKKENNEANIA